jgi:hypothetical protein
LSQPPDSERGPAPDPELAEVARLLDEVAAQEALETREAEALRDAPGLERVERSLSSQWAPAPAARGRRRWAVVAAAAALLLLFLWLREGGEPAPVGPSGEYLSDPAFELVAPPGLATGWDRIEWTGPAQATYRVTVRDALTGRPVFGPSEPGPGTRLLLAPQETERWPSRILIEVELRRADGTWIAAEPRESERLP